MATNQDNWFERNPKKIIVLTIFVILTASTYGLEKYLAYKNNGIGYNFALQKRAIVMREFRPLLKEYNYPVKEDEPYDTIEKKNYLLRVDDNGFIMPSKKYSHAGSFLSIFGRFGNSRIIGGRRKKVSLSYGSSSRKRYGY